MRSNKVFEFVALLRAATKRTGGYGCDMAQASVDPHCGTPGCHGGWAGIALNVETDSYLDGGDALAKHLGFNFRWELKRWALQNPDIWGNRNGLLMFGCPSAFDQKNTHFSVDVLIDWWQAVGERLLEKERLL
jgi:hypothetical protein